MAEQNGFQVLFPAPEFCTDNGAMIAHAGALRLAALDQQSLADLSQSSPLIDARARWPLAELTEFKLIT